MSEDNDAKQDQLVNKSVGSVCSPEAIERSPETPNFRYTKLAPSLGEILYDDFYKPNLRERNEPLPVIIDKKYGQVREKDLLSDLVDVMSRYAAAGQASRRGQIITEIEDLTQLKYIGVEESQKAIDAMALRLMAYVQNEFKTVIYLPDNRSDRYVALRMLQRIEQIDPTQQFLSKLQVLDKDSIHEFGSLFRENGDKLKIIVPDDQVISGEQGSEFAKDLFNVLTVAGATAKEASNMTEFMYMAAPQPSETKKKLYKADKILDPQTNQPIPMNIYSYYSAPISETKTSGQLGMFSMAHCLADYSMTNKIKRVVHMLQAIVGQGVVRPWFSNMTKPYETNEEGEFVDPKMKEDWERIYGKLNTADKLPTPSTTASEAPS